MPNRREFFEKSQIDPHINIESLSEILKKQFIASLEQHSPNYDKNSNLNEIFQNLDIDTKFKILWGNRELARRLAPRIPKEYDELLFREATIQMVCVYNLSTFFKP